MKKLDFNALEKPVLELTLKDEARTVVRATAPTEELGERLTAAASELQTVINDNTGETVRALYGLIAELMNCNLDGLTFDADSLRAKYKMNFYDAVLFVRQYLVFVNELTELSHEASIPVKIRMCDTMGYGVSYPGVALPRSVPGIVYGLHHYSDVTSEMLEWHGHNDFYKAVANASTAWLYGACAVNCSLLGIGERTGNVPLEAMVFEYASLRGSLDGMDTTVITEIADYFQNEIGYDIPPMTPYVGQAFNQTRAGIHADGLMKDEEIYTIFDTKKIPSPV